MGHRLLPILTSLLICIAGCNSTEQNNNSNNNNKLFTLVSSEHTNIKFSNTLNEGPNANVLMYEYFYNGGGVAVGDLNGDGLEDLYFSGNMTDNKLYLNKGGLQFEDVSDIAGVTGRKGHWKTGVTIADINGDGKLDIFVCYSGMMKPENRVNQLFINSGNDSNARPIFKNMAESYGLTNPTFSTQGYFFDMDRDGDLDLFLLNHNPGSLPVLDEAATSNILKTSDKEKGVRLFKQENNKFIDITETAGISSSALTYGLGAGIADIDGDGWQDIYVSNDYTAPDYLYINDQNGHFTNKIQSSLQHISHFSMGNDITDINNDGFPDIFTLDMLPEDNRRQKLLFAPDNYEKFDLLVRTGSYYQYMRNMLHLNNGDGTFSEIGQLAGISNTDWSWAPLFADYNNDGLKDLYVTNGFLRDFTNMDFMKYMNDYLQSKGRLNRADVQELISKIPSTNTTNYMFKNNGNLSFTNSCEEWGLSVASNSNGGGYADLDNDGDLDLVVNNINAQAFILRNNTNHQNKQNNYLQIRLSGTGKNTSGIGAKVVAFVNGTTQYYEQMPARGYQSTVSEILHFGFGKNEVIDSLKVTWLSGKQQILKNIKAGQRLFLEEKNAGSIHDFNQFSAPFFVETIGWIKYKDSSENINDFKRQTLLLNPLSFSGPCMAKADVNNDGLEDVFIGGGSGKSATLFLQQKNGSFIQKKQSDFESDKFYEDASAVFTDINNDGFMDLYVASGGYHLLSKKDSLLQDRIYMNDGKSGFTKNKKALPPILVSKSCVSPSDINSDGYIDFFVGGRVVPGSYPIAPESFILINNRNGTFSNNTALIAPELQKSGMITSAVWSDINGDKIEDLVVAGEWMPITVYINSKGKLQNKTNNYFSQQVSGLWNCIKVTDLNKDGRPDIIAGNMGLNTQLSASVKEPLEMYYKDFDKNGSIDPIMVRYVQHKAYPFVTRDELLDQISMMRSRFTDYKGYADATLNDVFSKEELKDAIRMEVNQIQTTFFEMNKAGKFQQRTLPIQTQFSPVFTITELDFNHDGNKDLLLCGNIKQARLRFGKNDANYGLLFMGDGTGNFTAIDQHKSGFHIIGDVRSVLEVNNKIVFGINQQSIKIYELNKENN